MICYLYFNILSYVINGIKKMVLLAPNWKLKLSWLEQDNKIIDMKELSYLAKTWQVSFASNPTPVCSLHSPHKISGLSKIKLFYFQFI